MSRPANARPSVASIAAMKMAMRLATATPYRALLFAGVCDNDTYFIDVDHFKKLIKLINMLFIIR